MVTPDGHQYAQAAHPYLGPRSSPRTYAGAAPWVNRIHCFTFPAYLSHGPISGDIPAISTGAERVATGVATALFAEDYERTLRRMVGWSNPELRGDEYVLDDDVSEFLAGQPADVKT